MAIYLIEAVYFISNGNRLIISSVVIFLIVYAKLIVNCEYLF